MARLLRNTLPAAALALTACAALSPQADQTQYFVLSPRAAPAEAPVPLAATLGIGPVTVPDHLDQRLVTRLASEEIAISDTQRWAEPLRLSLTTVLQQNLDTLLEPERILVYPWRPSAPPDLAVEIVITDFERTTNGTIRVGARWSVQRGSATTPLVTNTCQIERTFHGKDARAAVASLSDAVGEMSRRIASDLRRVPRASGEARRESDGGAVAR